MTATEREELIDALVEAWYAQASGDWTAADALRQRVRNATATPLEYDELAGEAFIRFDQR